MFLDLDKAIAVDPTFTQDDIDALEAMVRTITNNRFNIIATNQHGVTFGEDTIKIASVANYRVKDTVEIFGTGGINDGVFDITAVDTTTNTLTVRMPTGYEAFITGTYPRAGSTLVRYPRDVAYNVLKLIGYEYAMADKKGLKSESIARLSVTYFDMTANESREGFPAAYIEWLDKYTVVKWD